MFEWDKESSVSTETREVAVSAYADMLHDDERNLAWYQAIKATVHHLVNKKKRKFFYCCDIGTGSGILSMMVARSFLELNYKRFHVIGFEQFKPMAACATKVVASNKLDQYITILPMRANQYEEDIKFDLLVAELLDTELIGENCIQVYNDMVENFCRKDCLFVPHKAKIYIEPVASSNLNSRHWFRERQIDLKDNQQVFLKSLQQDKECPGVQVIDDMQVTRLREGKDFIRFTEPQVAFEFIFSECDCFWKEKVLDFIVEKKVCEKPVIVMWWEIQMTILEDWPDLVWKSSGVRLDSLSCAPGWARSVQLLERDKAVAAFYGRSVWREHWIQGIYYLGSMNSKSNCILEKGDSLRIYAYHDSCSMWFDVNPQEDATFCKCGFHMDLCRGTLSFLNDSDMIGPLIESALGDKTNVKSAELEVIKPSGSDAYYDERPRWKIVLKSSSANDLTEETSILYDRHLAGWQPGSYLIKSILMNQSISPIKMFLIKFRPVVFKDLHRIQIKRENCEGFDLKELDHLLDNNSVKDQFSWLTPDSYVANELTETILANNQDGATVLAELSEHALKNKCSRQLGGDASTMYTRPESHYLWEYEMEHCDSKDYVAFSSLERASLFERKEFVLPAMTKESVKSGLALVFWTEVKLEHNDHLISCGPLGDTTEWNRYCMQQVYFMQDQWQDESVHVSIGLDRDAELRITSRQDSFHRSSVGQ